MDIATVDILDRASKADPQGKRTVGVFTKPDLIGEGEHAPVVQALLNKAKPLKLGYVMVKVYPANLQNHYLQPCSSVTREPAFFCMKACVCIECCMQVLCVYLRLYACLIVRTEIVYTLCCMYVCDVDRNGSVDIGTRMYE